MYHIHGAINYQLFYEGSVMLEMATAELNSEPEGSVNDIGCSAARVSYANAQRVTQAVFRT